MKTPCSPSDTTQADRRRARRDLTLLACASGDLCGRSTFREPRDREPGDHSATSAGALTLPVSEADRARYSLLRVFAAPEKRDDARAPWEPSDLALAAVRTLRRLECLWIGHALVLLAAHWYGRVDLVHDELLREAETAYAALPPGAERGDHDRPRIVLERCAAIFATLAHDVDRDANSDVPVEVETRAAPRTIDPAREYMPSEAGLLVDRHPDSLLRAVKRGDLRRIGEGKHARYLGADLLAALERGLFLVACPAT